MDLSAWFSYQLKAGYEGFIWAIRLVPPERVMQKPPAFGEWSATRQAFHMVNYERSIALPSTRQWFGDSLPSEDRLALFDNEDAIWEQDFDLETVLAEFEAGRKMQIELVESATASLWKEPRTTIWGEVTLEWVVSKTFQHTNEHTCTVMQMVLFWDMALAGIARQGELD